MQLLGLLKHPAASDSAQDIVTLLTDLGTGHEVHEMDADKVLDAMHWLRNREGG